jgi:hypothetical protein
MTHKYAVGFGSLLLAAVLIAAFGVSAFAFHSPEHYSLFSDASYVSPGNGSDRAVKLVSDSTPGWGGVDYGVEEGVSYADLTALSTDYMLESDDVCAGGSPRFQVALEDATSGDTGNIFVYLGDAPNYTCASGVWLSSGDLIGTGTVDSSQLDGGTFYDTYASSLEKYGDYTVTGIQLVADGGWAAGDAEQAVTVDNTLINSTLFTYEIPLTNEDLKNQCKDGGWRNMTDNDGSSFKNQGQCVSFFATGSNDE